MGLSQIKGKIFSPIGAFINEQPFIKACLYISGGALLFLLGANVGSVIKSVMS